MVSSPGGWGGDAQDLLGARQLVHCTFGSSPWVGWGGATLPEHLSV